MINELVCVVGPSNSRETTICDVVCARHGLASVASMTTRPPCYEGKTGHVGQYHILCCRY